VDVINASGKVVATLAKTLYVRRAAALGQGG
jgi:hypothetical protein